MFSFSNDLDRFLANLRAMGTTGTFEDYVYGMVFHAIEAGLRIPEGESADLVNQETPNLPLGDKIEIVEGIDQNGVKYMGIRHGENVTFYMFDTLNRSYKKLSYQPQGLVITRSAIYTGKGKPDLSEDDLTGSGNDPYTEAAQIVEEKFGELTEEAADEFMDELLSTCSLSDSPNFARRIKEAFEQSRNLTTDQIIQIALDSRESYNVSTDRGYRSFRKVYENRQTGMVYVIGFLSITDTTTNEEIVIFSIGMFPSEWNKVRFEPRWRCLVARIDKDDSIFTNMMVIEPDDLKQIKDPSKFGILQFLSTVSAGKNTTAMIKRLRIWRDNRFKDDHVEQYWSF